MASSKGSDTRPRINEAARAEVLGRGTRDVPTTRACLNLAKRLESHGESYYPGKKVSHPCTYLPDAPARALRHSPRWRVGFV